MKNTILTAAFLLVSTFGFAQDKTTSTESKEHAKMEKVGHGCHMADAQAMESLNLTAEQKTQMEAIMADCNKACSTSEGDAQRKEVMEKYQGQIKEVLSEEQFASWKTSCDAMHKEHGEKMDKEHMEHKKATEEKK
ncbi:MAG: hypothetical protein WAR83_00250 [Flavobacteriales bacterium]|jgi:Spy/CpxP family protein refolding chaperone